MFDAPAKGKSRFINVCLALFVTLLLWAAFAQLDEVTRGDVERHVRAETAVLSASLESNGGLPASPPSQL
mgnify:CR=1 FL=1